MMAGALRWSTRQLTLVAVSVSTIAAAPVQPDRSSIPFRIIAQGSDSPIHAHHELIIRMPGVWDFVWRKHANSAPPEIDFRREIVIAIFAGRQATAAAVLQIAAVVEEDGSIVVRYHADTVQATTLTSSSPTSPFVIIAISAAACACEICEGPGTLRRDVTTRAVLPAALAD